MVVSLVLAAGEGKRFGACKQLAILDGRPLIQHALQSAAKSGTEETVLVLGCRARQIEAAVDLSGVRIVRADAWRSGPQASLAAGLAALGGTVSAALVTLGDEPLVPVGATRRLLAARRPGLPALRATYDGRPGHPVLIERALFPRLIASGRTSAKPGKALREAGVSELECGDLGSPIDVDTPDQLAQIHVSLRRIGLG